MEYTALQNPQRRQEQYIQAVNYYLKNSKIRIVFVENTNNDISPFFKNAVINHRIEFITFNGNQYDKKLGKGFGEAEIIEFAIKNSRFIRESDYIIKITGRLIPRNFKLLLTDFMLHPNFDVVASYVCIGLMDSRFVIAKPDFWEKTFLPNRHRLNDHKGYFFEHLLVDCSKKVLWRPFLLTLPCFDGISGTFGNRIENLSWKSKDLWRKLCLNWKYYYNRKNG